MLNEIYLGMYRTAVESGRLLIEFVPVPYRAALIAEKNPPVTPSE
ncbi:hypothetical protein [Paenibacillus sp. L3-i20]|nr:hypothetical protein [Paenibacillus sp. L3-i20]GKU75646.1 hypothetical protein L3i20_v200430 [Paenibacillus sp. L3-i20]